MHGGLILPLGEHGGTLARGLMLRFFLLNFLSMAAAVGVAFTPTLRSLLHGWPIMTTGSLACIAGFFLSYHLAARRLIRSDYRVCLKCRKPLPGGKEWGECPACSLYFNIPEIKAEFESPFSFTGSAHVPGALRRYRGLASLGGAMCTAAALLGVLGVLGLPLRYFEWVFGGLMVGGVAAALPAFVLERRLLTRVKKASYRVCPDCQYSLESAGKGKCPECGRDFDEDSLRHDWQRCMRRWNM